MNNETIFNGTAQIVLNAPSGLVPNLKEVNFVLEIVEPGPLDPDKYFEGEGLPSAAGVKVLTNCFIQGLVANIKSAAARGVWDPRSHFEFVIKEISRAMEAPATHQGVKTFRGK